MNNFHAPTLTDEERAAGLRLTNDGRTYGTPRTATDDPRFDQSALPAHAFWPNTAAVLAVLERTTRFTLADARRLVRAARTVSPEPSRHDFVRYGTAAFWASRAAGPARAREWDRLDEVVVDALSWMIRPELAARAPGRGQGPATADWEGAFHIVLQTVRALLVADRPEQSPEGLAALTAAWTAAFDDPRTLLTGATAKDPRGKKRWPRNSADAAGLRLYWLWARALDARMRAGDGRRAANPFRVTSDGRRLYGTPRTSTTDWRFERAGWPPRPFAPSADAVWAVLDRLSWCGVDDMDRLLSTPTPAPSEAKTTHNGALHAVRCASRAAGVNRTADHDVLPRLVEQIGQFICPEPAGATFLGGDGPRTRDWREVIRIATTTAQALLVADRITPEQLELLTGRWRCAFG